LGGGGGGFGQGGGGFGQGGGGFGQGGGRGGRGSFFSSDPDKLFAQLAGATGGQVIDMSRLPAESRLAVQRQFQSLRMTPPADNAVISKAQFLDSYTKVQQARANFQGGPGGPGMQFNKGNNSSFKMYSGGSEVTLTPSNGGNFQFQMNGMGMGRNRGDFGNRGNDFNNRGNDFNNQDRNASFDRRGSQGFGMMGRGDRDKGERGFRLTDEGIQRKFAQLDFNHDDKLSPDEMPEKSKLQEPETFKEFDKDQDGYLDFNEYKAFIAKELDSDPDAGSFGSSAQGNYGKDKKQELSVAIRFGKLPAGLPEWWTVLDTDKDGQVGLYEWRADGRDMKEFTRYDLDGDGMLAPQEWQRYNVLSAQQAKAFAAQEDIDGVTDGPTTPGRGPGSANSRGPGRQGFGMPKGGPGSNRIFGPGSKGPGTKGSGTGPGRGKGPNRDGGGKGSREGGRANDSDDGGDPGGSDRGNGSNPFRGGRRKN
jgi:hypothetical protein